MAKDSKSPKAEKSSVGHCCFQGCKGDDSKFGFCAEHYKYFKFGLVKKNGQKVSDFEKKFEHFQFHQKKFAKSA